MPGDAIEADHREITNGFIERPFVARVDDDVEILVERDERSGPVGEALVERNVDRTGHVLLRVARSRPRVDDERLRREYHVQRGTGVMRWTPEATEGAGTFAIDTLPVGDVLRWFGLAGEHRAPDLRFVF